MSPEPHSVSLVEVQYRAFLGKALDPGRLDALDDALQTAKGYGWRVVGVSLPFSDYWRSRLERTPETHDVITAYRSRMPGLFARYGFRFVDLTNRHSVPCGEHEFSHDDGGHPNLACGRRIRRLLDAAARASGPLP